jgi:hypothetical protein
MQTSNKITHIDGLPGFALQGRRGATGTRGCKTFVFSLASEKSLKSNVDKWSTSTENIVSLRDFPDFKLYDDIINTYGEYTYIFTVTSIDADKKTATVKCIDKWLYDTVYEISVIPSIKEFTYQKVDKSNDTLSSTPATVEYILFDVLSDNIDVVLGNIRVEVEFISNYQFATMSSCIPEIMFDNDDTSDAQNHPYGYPNKYVIENTFDNEDFGNFKIVVKDFQESTQALSHRSSIKIRKQDVINSKMRVYVYEKRANSVISKEFLGECSVDELTEY